mgnify:CR=1 FL=1
MAALSDPDAGLRAEGEADTPPAGSSEERGNQEDKRDVMEGGSVSFIKGGGERTLGKGVGGRLQRKVICVYLQLIHIVVQQNLIEHCEAVILQ